MNTKLLIDFIEEMGIKKQTLVKKLGLSSQGFYNKLEKGNFSITEALTIQKALRLTDDEFKAIFSQNVGKNSTN